MRKKLAVLSAALAAVLAIQAGLAVTAAADDSAELVWWGWTPGSPTNEGYIEEFNKIYPDIHVTWKQVPIDDYDATIKPALANGESVDCFEVSAGSANGGWLHRISRSAVPIRSGRRSRKLPNSTGSSVLPACL